MGPATDGFGRALELGSGKTEFLKQTGAFCADDERTPEPESSLVDSDNDVSTRENSDSACGSSYEDNCMDAQARKHKAQSAGRRPANGCSRSKVPRLGQPGTTEYSREFFTSSCSGFLKTTLFEHYCKVLEAQGQDGQGLRRRIIYLDCHRIGGALQNIFTDLSALLREEFSPEGTKFSSTIKDSYNYMRRWL